MCKVSFNLYGSPTEKVPILHIRKQVPEGDTTCPSSGTASKEQSRVQTQGHVIPVGSLLDTGEQEGIWGEKSSLTIPLC